MTSDERKLTGAVMVVGGGISGMQSALDLAGAGFKVYLAEERTAIGGSMARLDKTFPTNDCAMCIMSPKLVDAGRHLNIELLTGVEVLEVAGEEGNFQVRLRKKARYIDLKACVGCGECAAACPVEVRNEFDAGLAGRKAAYKLYPQATPGAYAIEKAGVPPCRAACPAGVNAQGYVQLIRTGKFVAAWQLIYRDNPFPAVCGRVCSHPCQDACHRGEIDQAVNIRHLKRLPCDAAYSDPETLPLPEIKTRHEERVAVAGSGPAGLSAAYHLARRGYRVTVFEALPVAGGMMRVAIPAYRLPKELVDFEIGLIEKLGVEIKTGVAIGPGLTVQDLLDKGFRSVFLAVGARRSARLGIPGEELAGVRHVLSFLRQVNLGEKVRVGRRVAVIGGGNSAMDAARTALRLGAAEVTVLYRRTFEEITALPEEIEEAREEGVIFRMLASPVAFAGEEGRLKAVRAVENALGEPGPDGRRRPEPVPGSEFCLEVDTAIVAVGQVIDTSFLEQLPLSRGRGGSLKADPLTLATEMPGVFAGGDAVTGPKTVIDAVGAGKLAADSIHRYLRGLDLVRDRDFRVPEEKIAPLPAGDMPPDAPASPVTHLPPEARVKGFSEVSRGYTAEEAQAEAARCLNCGVCSECLECVKVCMPKAIKHDMRGEDVTIPVGAVILSPGFEPFDARALESYGYGRYPGVVTSIEFERILSASGPFGGHLVRPADGREPGRIAWIQCVGSRNLLQDRGYCSGVCCMYAIKEAVIAREHSRGIKDTAIFFMDMRTHGKDFEKYYRRAETEHGLRFVRSRVYSVEEAQDGSRNLLIRYAREDGSLAVEEFDLVVLSVGLGPSKSSGKLAAAAGVELNRYGFCRQGEFTPGCASRPGIYAAGAFAGPKDIPETVVEAGAAAANAACLLAPARGSMAAAPVYPPEKKTGRTPRVGVFVCNCGINIGSVVRVGEVVEYARGLKNVAYAEEFLFTCSQDNVDKIRDRIEEYGLNRLVVASCTPRTHAPLFRNSLKEAGLNPYLYEQANIREHSSWVHRDNPGEATAKAKDLVAMAVAKARLLKPVEVSRLEINRRALVVGGGLAGLTASLSLAAQGFPVTLLERKEELGGNLLNIRYTIQGNDTRELLAGLLEKVRRQPLIEVLTGAEIENAAGFTGNFTTMVRVSGEYREINHGVTIMATGAREAASKEYLYGGHPAVHTQRELEGRLARGEAGSLKTVVMIQCVGSREQERPYCSRVCCQQAVKNALKIKEENPGAVVYVLYREMRTYGLLEDYYTEARMKGVVFFRYDLEDKPLVEACGERVTVSVNDLILGRTVQLDADLLVLGAGVEPQEDAERLARLFKVPAGPDGFFSEAHMKLRPVDFANDGLYLCGMAHSPKTIPESIAQANAAAMRAAVLLSRECLETLSTVVTVDPALCRGCGLCVAACEYGARELDPWTGVARVREVLCQGCGACAAACPGGACQQKGFEKKQLLSMIEEAI